MSNNFDSENKRVIESFELQELQLQLKQLTAMKQAAVDLHEKTYPKLYNNIQQFEAKHKVAYERCKSRLIELKPRFLKGNQPQDIEYKAKSLFVSKFEARRRALKNIENSFVQETTLYQNKIDTTADLIQKIVKKGEAAADYKKKYQELIIKKQKYESENREAYASAKERLAKLITMNVSSDQKLNYEYSQNLRTVLQFERLEKNLQTLEQVFTAEQTAYQQEIDILKLKLSKIESKYNQEEIDELSTEVNNLSNDIEKLMVQIDQLANNRSDSLELKSLLDKFESNEAGVERHLDASRDAQELKLQEKLSKGTRRINEARKTAETLIKNVPMITSFTDTSADTSEIPATEASKSIKNEKSNSKETATDNKPKNSKL